MGEFRDLLDAVKDLHGEVKRGVSAVGIVKRPKSIAASATDGICYFPVVVDDSIPLEDALIIARALERKYATFVLTTLTMNPYMQIENGEISAADYVKKFHQNMRVKPTSKVGLNLVNIPNLMDVVDSYNFDTTGIESLAEATAWKIYQHVSSGSANAKASKWNFTVEEMLSPSIANDISKVRPMLEASGKDGSTDDHTTDSPDGSLDGVSKPSTSRSGRGSSASIGNVDVRGYGGAGGKALAYGGKGGQATGGNATINKGAVQISVRAGNRGGSAPMNHLMDTEFKKANDLVPTMLHIRIFPTAPEGEELPEPVDFVLGVKATLHSVTADAMAENLARGVNQDNHFFEFIKWYTGETKFFKDFVFAIDQQKSDARANNDKNKGWFVASKRRKALAKIHSKVCDNPLTPIMTIVASQDTISQVASVYGYDFEASPGLTRSIMTNYFLLGFVKVNPATNRIDFLFDGFDAPETVTLNTLQREETRDDKKFKDMMKLIGRGF